MTVVDPQPVTQFRLVGMQQNRLTGNHAVNIVNTTVRAGDLPRIASDAERVATPDGRWVLFYAIVVDGIVALGWGGNWVDIHHEDEEIEVVVRWPDGNAEASSDG